MPQHKPRRASTRIAPDDAPELSFFSPSPMPHTDSLVSELDLHKLTVLGQVTQNTYIPPWTEPYVIGVAGFLGLGKTSISQRIILELNQPWTVLLLFDNFYKPLLAEESQQAFANNHDFDTPRAIDLDLAAETLVSLKKGKKTTIPVYSFQLHARTDKTITIYGANVIIIEGIYALYDERLLRLMDMKIFVDTDLDVCLARRLTRDILYRGRNLAGALDQWERFVKPNAVAAVQPTMQNADIIIPRGLDNVTAIELMIKHIQKQLAIKSDLHLRRLKALGHGIRLDVTKLKNLQLLPANNHTAGIHSILFSASTNRGDFIFYFDRIANLLVEAALETLSNYSAAVVPCHRGYRYAGLAQTGEIVAVSIIRSGDCFMNSIKKTFPAIPIGKLLIQSDSITGEPQLHMESLPPMNDAAIYFLFDAQIISGAGAIMAIQVLVDHKVETKNIVMIAYLLTEIGVKRILNVFPDITLVVGKMSNVEEPNVEYNKERFRDSDWPFRTRFIDALYFGTD